MADINISLNIGGAVVVQSSISSHIPLPSIQLEVQNHPDHGTRLFASLRGHRAEIYALEPEICLVYARSASWGENKFPDTDAPRPFLSKKKIGLVCVSSIKSDFERLLNPVESDLRLGYPANYDGTPAVLNMLVSGNTASPDIIGNAIASIDTAHTMILFGKQTRIRNAIHLGEGKITTHRSFKAGICVRVKNPAYAAVGGKYFTGMGHQVYYFGVPAYLFGEISPLKIELHTSGSYDPSSISFKIRPLT
jgi:hypothetical protein